MKNLLSLFLASVSSLSLQAQSVSPAGLYGASNTSSAGGVSISWVIGSLTPQIISALPVTLINFECTLSDASTSLLQWSTSEETNSDYFEIQHSVNGKQWNEIGRVQASGKSTSAKTYSFAHTTPAGGDNFYRLKMVDQDGTFAYSRMRNVNVDGSPSISFHPNPVTDLLKIDAADWTTFDHLSITDVAGNTVIELNTKQLGDLPEKAINVQNLPLGIYMIQILRQDGTITNGKVFKN